MAAVAAVLLAAPASAQARRPSAAPEPVPRVALRPFFLLSGEDFFAGHTFDAAFGRSVMSLWGGGIELALRNGLYVDVTASRFTREGERAFFFGGQGFGLGIPLTVTLTPLELTVGGRMRLARRTFAYAGGGLGSYSYTETSEGGDPDGDFSRRHTGYLVVGGVEHRPTRWLGLSGDLQMTRVPGILGEGGISKEAGEDNLGGVALRFRVILGR